MSDGAQFSGTDQEGRVYQAPSELWEENKDGDGSHENWYKKAVAYWDQQEPTYNGVLGGFGFVSEIDIRDSKALLEKVMKPALDEVARGARSLAVLDCGAGVGRVTNELLLFLFQEVDLLEPSKPLLECARKHLTSGKVAGVPAGHRAVNFYCTGLQEHVFETGRYDVIWIQWCLLYLTDADVPVMLERAAAGLKPGGFVVFKENVCKEGFVVDNDDSSLTRSNSYLLDLINRSGWTLLQSAKQKNFPKDLFDVRMRALRQCCVTMCEAVDAQAGCVEGQAESPVLSLAAFGRLHSVHTLTLRSMACLRRMLLVEPPGAVFPRLQSLRLRLGGAAIASPADYEAIASAAPQGCTPW